MFILQQYNIGVYEFLQRQFSNAKNGGKPENVESTIPDFDGAQYYLVNKGDNKNIILVSLSIRYYEELKSHGCDAFLRSEYAGYIEPQPFDKKYNVTLSFDLTKLPDDIDALALKAAHLKRNCFASVFIKYFDLQSKLEKGEQADHTRAVIHYRPDETLYIDAKNDRVTVIFSTLFKETDAVTGRLFLQEFAGKGSSQTAPQVIVRLREPPTELGNCKDALVGDNVGYITFVLFPRHTNQKNRDNTIDLLHIFRDYLHYHIKCSKAYLHERFRHKTADFLKVLNRAKPLSQEKHVTIDGRTFVMDRKNES